MGSSPRVWGQVDRNLEHHNMLRDHPHACGDKRKTKFCNLSEKGSSPRVWGQEDSIIKHLRCFRIIPTRVGTRQQVHNQSLRRRDHPHACGDKHGLKSADRYLRGSSPRVWGQESTPLWLNSTMRIIPTRVGTSIEKCISYFSSQDHPHACGDKIIRCT